jgi:hypothetical protein
MRAVIQAHSLILTADNRIQFRLRYLVDQVALAKGFFRVCRLSDDLFTQ